MVRIVCVQIGDFPMHCQLSLHGPAHEYVRLLRSCLSDVQCQFVRDQIEASLLHQQRVSIDSEADLIQSLLTAEQSADVARRLALIYAERGWIASS
jgi:hypothetical protein